MKTCVVVVLLLIHVPAFAAESVVLSPVERAIADAVLHKHQLEIDTKAEGKLVRQFIVDTLEPFGVDDGFLTFFNNFQSDTRESAVLSQLTFSTKSPFSWRYIDESVRALQAVPVRSLVIILPVQPLGQASDKEVDVLVLTRDVFSWRLNTDLTLVGSSVIYGYAALGQFNLLGYNKSISASYIYRPILNEVGLTYSDPGVLGSYHTLQLQQSAILSLRPGLGSGTSGYYAFALPLWSESSQWGYGANVNYTYAPYVDALGTGIREWKGIERKFWWFQLSGTATGVRSFGDVVKHNIEFGYGLNIYRPSFLDDFPQDPKIRQEFKREIMPFTETESFLSLNYTTFMNRFVTLHDLNTFVFGEILRTGPTASITTNVGLTPLLSDANFVRFTGQAGYNAEVGKGGWLALNGQGSTRLGAIMRDQLAGGSVFFATPLYKELLRFVVRVSTIFQWNNWRKTQYVLGGDVGLRGVPAQYYQGNNYWIVNTELRTRSWPVWISHVGGVLFFDVGTAFDDIWRSNPTSSLGVGLRILLPQINRGVIRVDLGVPVGGPLAGALNTLVTAGFGQAF